MGRLRTAIGIIVARIPRPVLLRYWSLQSLPGLLDDQRRALQYAVFRSC